MECSVCRQLAVFRRIGGPAELAPEDVAALDRHLAGCPACAAAVARQDAFDAAVARAVQAVSVPNGLRDRLLADAMARRGAEWRRGIGRGLAVAAGVLLAGLIGVSVHARLRPAFDAPALADDFALTNEAPEQAVGHWLSDRGLPPQLRPDFDFRYYTEHGTKSVKGRDVPFVLFSVSRPGSPLVDTARVYVVRRGQFDLSELREAQNSFCTVQYFKDEVHDVAYVVLYTTPSLDPFLKPNRFQNVARA